MPIYVLDFVLHGEGDIAVEADDPGDAERKFSAIPVEGLLMAKSVKVRQVSLLPEDLVPVYRQLAEDYAKRGHRKADEASTADMESVRKNPAFDLLPAQERTPMVTKDELIEKALREEGVFPPSVMDRYYGDKAEMTKAEIIVKSVEEMGMLSLSEQVPQFSEKIRRIPIVIAELQRKLPEGKIKTCGAFRSLGVGCCDLCHTDPLHEMTIPYLPDGSKAWICCAVDAASSPEPYPVFHERKRNSPGGRMPTGKSGNGGRREN